VPAVIPWMSVTAVMPLLRFVPPVMITVSPVVPGITYPLACTVEKTSQIVLMVHAAIRFAVVTAPVQAHAVPVIFVPDVLIIRIASIVPLVGIITPPFAVVIIFIGILITPLEMASKWTFAIIVTAPVTAGPEAVFVAIISPSLLIVRPVVVSSPPHIQSFNINLNKWREKRVPAKLYSRAVNQSLERLDGG
jgi:hypothetical protein